MGLLLSGLAAATVVWVYGEGHTAPTSKSLEQNYSNKYVEYVDLRRKSETGSDFVKEVLKDLSERPAPDVAVVGYSGGAVALWMCWVAGQDLTTSADGQLLLQTEADAIVRGLDLLLGAGVRVVVTVPPGVESEATGISPRVAFALRCAENTLAWFHRKIITQYPEHVSWSLPRLGADCWKPDHVHYTEECAEILAERTAEHISTKEEHGE
jgi:hypothetical protein